MEESNNTKSLHIAGLSLLFAVVLIGILYYYNCTHFNATFYAPAILTCFIACLFCVVVFNIRFKWKYFYVLLVLIGMLFVFTEPVYSVIDEAAHFSYIEFIREYKTLPTIYDPIYTKDLSMVSDDFSLLKGNHEAVQPPIYYVLMALVSSPASSIVTRFYIIRSVGALLLLGIVWWSKKCLELTGVFDGLSEDTVFAIYALFFLSPGIITRSTTISNEALACLFTVISVYYSLRILLSETIKNKDVCLATLFVVLAVLTKNTTAFAFVLLMVSLLHKKEVKRLFVSTLAVVVGCIPWLIYNWRIYNSFTGISAHMDLIIPLLGAENRGLPVLNDTISIFTLFFSPSEMKMDFAGTLISFMGVALWVFIFIASGLVISYIVREKISVLNLFYGTWKNEKMFVLAFMCAAVWGNVLILILGSISSGINGIKGRYVYLSAFAIIYIILFLMKNVDLNVKKSIAVFAVFMLCVMQIRAVLTYNEDWLNDSVASRANPFNVDLTQIEVQDVVNKDGYMICGDEDPELWIVSPKKSASGIRISMEGDEAEDVRLYYSDTAHEFDLSHWSLPYVDDEGMYCYELLDGTDVSYIQLTPNHNSRIRINQVLIY